MITRIPTKEYSLRPSIRDICLNYGLINSSTWSLGHLVKFYSNILDKIGSTRVSLRTSATDTGKDSNCTRLIVEFRRFHGGHDHSIVILINNRRSRAYSVIYTLYRSNNRITTVPTSAFKQRLMSEFLFCSLIKSQGAFGQWLIRISDHTNIDEISKQWSKPPSQFR